MKQFILFIFVVMFSFSMNLFAQKSYKDIINISENVSKEINEINKSAVKKTDKNNAEKENILISSSPAVNKTWLVKLFIFIEGSLLIFIGMIIKRKLEERKKYQLSQLKENIRKLRSEKIGSFFNTSYYKYRKKLKMQPIKISEKEITKRAKQYSIAKGELHLALKINLMQNSLQ